jgi:hypothetical protein
MNTMLHYFTWGENDTEAARRASSAPPTHSMVVPKSAVR